MKIYLKTFGCRVNQIESQSISESLEAAGHTICAKPQDADVCIINTCAVTGQADSDARKILRKLAAGFSGRVIVTGCYATAAPQSVTGISSGFEAVPNSAKAAIPRLVEPRASVVDEWLVTKRRQRTRAFVKVQDGCDFGCAYCIVPLCRPEKKSKPAELAAAEAAELVKSGYKEIVLSGINLGNYNCPASGLNLAGLLRRLFAIDGGFRIRLSSIESVHITDELLQAADSGAGKFCDYFHIPLQSGSDKVLQAMRRRYDTAHYAQAVAKIRARFPAVGIFSDIICGYPAETKEDHAATVEYIRNIGFAGLHVFRYSPREGTPASRLAPVPAQEVLRRSLELRALDAELRQRFAESLKGGAATVLIEKGGNPAFGLASNFQKVRLDAKARSGELVRARIESARAGVCAASPAGPV